MYIILPYFFFLISFRTPNESFIGRVFLFFVGMLRSLDGCCPGYAF